MEYLERLDRVKDDKRRKQLELDLKEIEAAIEALSEFSQQADTGMFLDDEALALLATSNYNQGVEMLRNLGKDGNIHAQKHLGKMYSEGNRVQEDQVEASKWYSMAAYQGLPNAQLRLGILYRDGIGVSQNDKLSVKWYTEAANRNDNEAQVHLGWMYEMGRGVPKNDELAIKWYKNLLPRAMKQQSVI